MMQLICNGESLDLNRDTQVSLKSLNPLFAFDNLSCERTTEFSLPDTPKNNSVLSIAKNPSFYGDGMRRRFDAHLIDGAIVKDGYLYVTKYSNGEYKTIFVTGELIGLMRIKNLGKIPQIVTFDDYVIAGQITTDASKPFATIQHIQDGGYKHPSSRIDSIVQKAVTENGLSPITLPASALYMRIVRGEVSPVNMVMNLTTQVTDSTQPTIQEPTDTLNTAVCNVNGMFGTKNVITSMTLIGATRFYNVRQFVPNQDITIKFSEDFDEKMYIVSWGEDYQDPVFIGGRSFTKEWDYERGETIVHRSGDPLSGRSVSIPQGTPFLILNEDIYKYEIVRFLEQQQNTIGWDLRFMEESLDLDIAGGEIQPGQVIRMQDNLPDMTLIDLLKSVAAVTGTSLNYTDADGVTFDDLQVSTWPIVDMSGKVLKMEDISRGFGDYAQQNIINFDSDDTIPLNQRITNAYMIDNDNLQGEKILQTIPFSEGIGGILGGSPTLELKVENTNDTMADARSAVSSYLSRVDITLNDGLVSLCQSSTSIVLTCMMTQVEFSQVKAKTLIQFHGQLYVWTDSTWSNNIAKFSLSKI